MRNKIQKKIDFQYVKKSFVEMWPALIIMFMMIIVLRHIADSNWSYYLLYHGDSTVLPLLFKSMAKHETFQWVFSSQTFIFPEALLYGFSSLLTFSVRSALIINSYLNVLILYICFRIITHFAVIKSKNREIILSLLMVTVLLLYVLLESTVQINYSSFVTPFLFTTYYSGVIISSMAVIALMFWMTDGFKRSPVKSFRTYLISTAIVSISVLVTFSNPLYLLQFSVPLIITLIIIYLFKKLSFRTSLLLITINTIPVMVGYCLRKPFAKFIAASVDSYIHPSLMEQSFKTLRISFTELSHSWNGLLKLAIIMFFLLLPFMYLLTHTYKIKRKSISTFDPAKLFISCFLIISLLTLMLGYFITGSSTTRYLLPLAIFPLLGLLLLEKLFNKLKITEYALSSLVISSLVLSTVALNSINNVRHMVNGTGYTSTVCLEKWAGGRTVSGVGDFWLTRELSLYGSDNVTTLQLNHDLTIMEWMINIGSYENKEFNFVLRDHGRSGSQFSEPPLEILGKPKEIIYCPDYDILNYAGTQGKDILNRAIDKSLNDIRQRRRF